MNHGVCHPMKTRPRVRRRALPWLAVCLLAGSSAVAGAFESDPIEITGVRVGIDGTAKLGYWTPVEIEVRGPTERPLVVEIESPDGDGLAVRYLQGAPVSFASGYQPVGLVKLGRPAATVVVRLREPDSRQVVATARTTASPLPSSVRWVLQIGADIGVERIEPYGERAEDRRVVAQHIAPDAADKLPPTWLGYDGVGVVFLTTGDPTWFARLTASQRESLVRWVREGGHLILTTAAHADSLTARHQFPAEWSAGSLTSVEDRFETTGLLHFTKAEQALAKRIDAQFAVLEDPRGPILAFEGAGGLGDRPLVVEHAVGFGRVTTLLVDIDRPPISQWLGLPRLMAKLAGVYRERSFGRRTESGSHLARVGYTDLVGQLRATLDQFQDVTLVRFSWIAAILVLYIVLIGPADYFGLAWLKRPHYTWITFTVIVVAFASLAAVLSSGVKARSLRRNQLQIVDIDIDTGRFRGTIWSHMYSPQLDQWNVELTVDQGTVVADPTETRLTWQGLPGTRIGALRGPTGVVVRSTPYEVRGDGLAGQVAGLPVLVSSTKSLLGRWYGEIPESWKSSAELRATPRGLLRGELRNPLPIDLTHCSIIYANWVYRLPGGLRAGERVRLDQLPPLDFRWQLTRRRVVEGHDVSVPWDIENTRDLPRIADMLMFHEAAGGSDYTHLDHNYQGWVDLSRHLDLRRAMLVGRAATHAATIGVQDRAPPPTDQSLTMVRILWPVQPAREEDDD